MARVLLVDDVRLTEELERTYLKRTGCRVETAGTGREVLEAARARRPDVVLLEVALPDMSGPDLCRALKADPATAAIPVLFVTSTHDYPRCLEAGADGFVPRPATRARLLSTLRRFFPLPERHEARFPVALKVTWRRGGDEGMAFTRDLAAGGVSLRTRDRFSPGDAVSLEFKLPAPGARALSVPGKVVYALRHEDGSADVGVRFEAVAARDRLEIGRYVREHAGDAA